MSIEILGKNALNETIQNNQEGIAPRDNPPFFEDDLDIRLFELTVEVTQLEGLDVEGVYEAKQVIKGNEDVNDYSDNTDGDTFTEAEGVLLYEINNTTGAVGKRVWARPVQNDEGDIERGAGGDDGIFEFEAVKKKYANSFFRSLYLITKRYLLLWVRDKNVLIFSVIRNIANGASVGGAFFNADEFISIQGALFQTGIFVLRTIETATGCLHLGDFTVNPFNLFSLFNLHGLLGLLHFGRRSFFGNRLRCRFCDQRRQITKRLFTRCNFDRFGAQLDLLFSLGHGGFFGFWDRTGDQIIDRHLASIDILLWCLR